MTTTSSTTDDDLDVVIIGAGIAGLEQLYELRRRGLRALIVEAGDGIGGTWWWNRYPGCRFDSESYSYGYFFSPELLHEWRWSEHFAAQPETERYLNHVADRFDLRRDIRLGRRIASAVFDETTERWTATTTDGERFTARYLVTAVGRLSQPQYPAVPGRERFAGEQHHTGLWPHEGVDLAGKRVAVIGVGSSGIQIATAIAPIVQQLTVFQSTPNWCAPLNNGPITPEEQAELDATYDEIHAACLSTSAGFIHRFHPGSAFDHSAEERRELYERLWTQRGFAKTFANFKEVLGVQELNDEFCAFVADKIRSRVNDPAVAEKLIPRDHGYAQKRPPHEEGYYEIYNRPNVRLVDVRETPMVEVTPAGIRTTDEELPFDVIVYATGFDALTGAFDVIDIDAGRGSLKDEWAEGPRTYLGIQSPGFPNLLFIGGPQSGGGNAPRCIEPQTEFIARLLADAQAQGVTRIEASEEAADAWSRHVEETVSGTLGARVKKDWAWGSNTPGKKVVYRSYGAGLPTYLARLAESEDHGWAGFRLTAAAPAAS
jgi:cation diffusion facilitator CzcD-associated flavoprotein CzcO